MPSYDGDESNSESVSDTEEAFYFKPSFVLFVIDIHESMFVVDETGQSPFSNCLRACYNIADSLVFGDGRGVKNPFGIVLASNNEEKVAFVDFEQPVPDTVKFLMKLVNCSNDALANSYKRQGNFDLADLILLCKKRFAEIKVETYKKSIVYITNDDNPVDSDLQKFKVSKEIENLTPMNISFHLVSTNRNFNYDTVYADILTQEENNRKMIFYTEVHDLEEMTDLMFSYIIIKYTSSPLKFYPFRNDYDRYFTVKVPALISEAYLRINAHVTRDEHKLVKKVQEEEDSSEHPMRESYEKEFRFLFSKTDSIILNENQKNKLQQPDLPCGLILLYVSEKVSKIGWLLEPISLLQMDPKTPSEFFDLFWQYCVDKSRVLICLRKVRVTGKVKYVELEPKLINNVRMFYCKVLTTRQDIISYAPQVADVEITAEEQKVTTSLVNALNFDYHPKMFLDPVYVKQKLYVRSQLLDQPMEEEGDSFGDDEKLDEHIAAEAQAFKNLMQVTDFKRKNVDEKGKGRGRGKKLRM